MVNNQTTYAVVDLETTGTSLDGQNRIIQFSCVLMQAGEVVNTFDTLVNPLCPVSEEVQNLTGIKQADLKQAPTFEEVAGSIYAFLQETVFVAHNIQFDYRFLNYELERVGYPSLDLPGLDTVQLAQIVYPKFISYRLEDLSRTLKLAHQPHRADSDALVTAQILTKILQKVATLPQATLKQLAFLGQSLVYETGRVFQIAARQKQSESLANEWVLVQDIVIRRPQSQTATSQGATYPQSDQEKVAFFKNKLTLRKKQGAMMDDLQTFFKQKKSREMLLQAPTGSGKTVAYLLPASFQALAGKKVVLATSTMTLAKQLGEEYQTKVAPLFDIPPQLVESKAKSHFLSLKDFWSSLKIPQNEHVRLLQMKILVWLLETQTGDLDELHLNQEPYLDSMAASDYLKNDDIFYPYDFWQRQTTRIKQAQMVVTTHANLVSHAAELSSGQAVLVVDEAHHLVQAAIKSNQEVLDFDAIKILADKIAVKMQSHVSVSFYDLINQLLLSKQQFSELLRALRVIDHEIIAIRTLFMAYLMPKKHQKFGITEVRVENSKLRGLIKANIADFQRIYKAQAEFSRLNQSLKTRMLAAQNLGGLSQSHADLLQDYFHLVSQLEQAMILYQKLVLEKVEQLQNPEIFWLSFVYGQENAHLRLHFGLLSGRDYLQKQVYRHFNKVAFVGAGIFTRATKAYVLDQLDLNPGLQERSYEEAFDYRNQAQAFLVNDGPDFTRIEESQYVEYQAQMLAQILRDTKRQTLVLFNSLNSIAQVYEKLAHMGLTKERVIYAQGVTGGPKKLAKRFRLDQDKKAVLLGTGTFFEGINLPNEQLELLIIARLPFQVPDSFINTVRYQRVQMQGKNPFSQISLPEAILRFQQGFGRLVRSEDDWGALVVLDSRVVTKGYGQQFRHALPSALLQKEFTSQKISQAVKEFFENHHSHTK